MIMGKHQADLSVDQFSTEFPPLTLSGVTSYTKCYYVQPHFIDIIKLRKKLQPMNSADYSRVFPGPLCS